MAADEVVLSSPLITVTLPDGATLTVQSINADLVNWDRTAHKHKWPKFDEAPFLWLTFLSWSAARRLGLNQDMSYETWESSILGVEAIETDARPTKAGPEPA